jgi:hypothetical protein
VNPLVRQVIGEAATPDGFSAKDYLLSLPQEYDGYKVHISADPMAWGGGRVTPDRALLAAHRMAEMAKAQFPGIQTDISLGPNTFPSAGLDAEVMEQIDKWLNDTAIDLNDGP